MAANCEPGEVLERLACTLRDERECSLQIEPQRQLAEALVLWRLKRLGDAWELLLSSLMEEAHANEPTYWILRGMLARTQPDGSAQALRAYRQALVLDGSRADLHYNLANLLREENPAAAENAYCRSLQLDPQHSDCWHNFGAMLHGLERSTEARLSLQRSIQLDPNAANVWCDLGNVLVALDDAHAAQRAFLLAISLDGMHGASHVNLGAALVAGLEPQQAITYLKRGVELQQSSADALFNLALAHLHLGEFTAGWAYYDARLSLTKDLGAGPPPTAGAMPESIEECPRGDDPPLVVWSEQGVGDGIHFCRYLALLEAARIPFEFRAPLSLLPLYRDWLRLGDWVVPATKSTDQTDQRPQIPLLSLPRLFGTTVTTIPSQLPYLHAPEPPPDGLKVPEPPGGLAVGLVWASHADNHKMYRRKSIPLTLLMPLFLTMLDLDLIDLHCLQCGVDEVQLQPWAQHERITSWAPQLTHFGDTAHVLNQLDLVISVDTAVAHLAGALGKPTWLLLPYSADFRWLQQRQDSPWYPGSMRLYRQSALGDWCSVVYQLQEAFNRLFLLDLDAVVSHTFER